MGAPERRQRCYAASSSSWQPLAQSQTAADERATKRGTPGNAGVPLWWPHRRADRGRCHCRFHFSNDDPYPRGGDVRLRHMDDDVEDFEPLVSRLHSVGQQPLDHALQQRVLARAQRSRVTWLHSTKLKVAAAMAGGFMIGSVGLASAGALPAPAQDVARAALGAIGVDVPPGHNRYNGPECGDVTSHGQYVDAHPDDPAAGKSPCGKPTRAVTHPHGSGTDPAGAPGVVGRHGPPPWAGQGKGKGKDKDKTETGDSPAADSPAIPEQSTTTAPAVTEMPTTTTTVAAQATATTSSTIETDTSTTTDSTGTTTTTEP
ncbi:MAG: hypothetical protein QOH53_740 [Ilumatobacteraceae bacterium]